MKFNGEANNVEASDFSVNKGTTNSNIAEVVIAEDKKSATIELSSKFTEGTYTVSVAQGESEALTGSVTVENEKVTELEILSEVAPFAEDKATATVGYQVLNQYGENITKAQFSNLEVTASGTSVKADENGKTASWDADGKLTIKLDATTAKADDSVTITIVDKNTAVVGTATVKLSAEATSSEVTVGELYNKDGKSLTQDTKVTDEFYLPVEVKDQYGKEITNEEDATEDLLVTNTNDAVATVGQTFESLIIDGKETLVLPVTLPANALAGSTNVVVVVKTSGQSSLGTVTVEAGRSIEGVTLGSPVNDVVVVGEDIKLPITLTDNEGNEVKTKKELGAIVNTRGLSDLAEGLEIVEEDGALYLVKDALNSTGSTSVLVASKSGKVSSQVVTVQAAPVVTTVSSVNTKTLATSLRENNTDGEDFSYSDFKFEDQYGRVIEEGNAAFETLDSVVLSAETALDPTKSPFVVDNEEGTIKLNGAEGVTATSDKITFTVTAVNGEALTEAKQAASAFTQTFTVVEDVAFDSYSVDEVDKVYVEKADDAYSVVDGYSSDDVTVRATTKNGETVKLDEGEYTATEVNLTDADFKDDVTTVTKNIIVTINSTGEEIRVPVTYSIEEAAIDTVASYDVADKDTRKAKTKATVNPEDVFGTTELLEAATFIATDQYGKEAVLSEDKVDRVTFTQASGKVTFSDNGSEDAEVSSATANSVVNATITTENGKTVTFQVTFENDFEVTPTVPPIEFTVSTSETANNFETLGLVGTTADSSEESVATVAIVADNIAVTSVSAGTSTITVDDEDESTTDATFVVTVAEDGSITLSDFTTAETVETP